MLVEVRPSNEALLRARVPGAQDQCGRSSLSILLRPRVARARRILSRLAHSPASFTTCPVYGRFDKPIEHVVCHSPCPISRSRVQCPDPVVAPMPVSDLTSWARKPPRSFAAWLLRSRIENNQIPTNPIVIENSAGEAYGNNALPFG